MPGLVHRPDPRHVDVFSQTPWVISYCKPLSSRPSFMLLVYPLVSNRVPQRHLVTSGTTSPLEYLLNPEPHAFPCGSPAPVVSLVCYCRRLQHCLRHFFGCWLASFTKRLLSITHPNISHNDQAEQHREPSLQKYRTFPSSRSRKEGKELGHISTKHHRDLGQLHTLLDLAHHPAPTSGHPRPRVLRALPFCAWRLSCRTPHPASRSSPIIH
ncbi:hypothetical protein QBC40DRAFT_65468 [Triangularia verruculosa]|uniref:Uncharacterized protein n=1 Tax=Triangularia verruculosa TaxID=2587418 RepID=A0AAN7AZ73_9PEZI|nr:hypothetical protein QBC40DRAFT_65468 [Triangularia verruculosa]